MVYSQLSPVGVPGRRYGSFAGRGPVVETRKTQLQPGAWPGRRYGSFAGRTASLFPTQYLGLRCYFQSAVQDLCLVAEADAPSGMGGVIKLDKNGTLYAVYLVDTSDPNASPVRVRTTTGTYAVRFKT